MQFERVGRYLAYPYLLRIPLLCWLFLTALPLLAIPSAAPLGALLRGVFDIAGPSAGRSAFAYGLVTLASLLSAMTVAVTGRLILVDGEERFGAGHVPRRPGSRLMFRIVPLLGIVPAIVGGTCYEAHAAKSAVTAQVEALGIIAGLVGFYAVTKLHERLWARLVARPREQEGVAPAGPGWRALALFTRLVLWGAGRVARVSPAGYLDDKRELLGRHKFAAIQGVLSLLFYVGLFLAKLIPTRGADAPYIPTLCLILVLVMLLCWAFSALTFFFDRFRVPLLLLLGTFVAVSAGLPQSDHFYTTLRLDPAATTRPSPSPGQLLSRRADRPIILVAASGGGIQAEAWTARVLSGIKQDFERKQRDFNHALVLVSAVSGGSVGSMFFLDQICAKPPAPVGDKLDEFPAVTRAEASSLDQVTWGLLSPDLIFGVAPFLKGLSLHPPAFFNGGNVTSDRGTALEDAWRLTPSLDGATLGSWQAAVAADTCPAAIFNSTIVETGQRLLLSTTGMGPSAGGKTDTWVGRSEFRELYPGFDLPVVTAARLSASFPFVTPAARIWRGDVFLRDYHVVDGGYYDNYGVATLVEWLNNGLLTKDVRKPSKVVIVQIRAAPRDTLARASRQRGWFFQTAAPLTTLEAVRGTAQYSRNEVAMNFITTEGLYYPTTIKTVQFEYRGNEQETPTEIPLSWHLTPAEKSALRWEWERSEHIRAARAALLQEFEE